MGVYIPNMDKPEYCRVCHERLKCKQYDGEILHTPDDCPLIDIVPCKECKMWNKFEGGIWEEVEGEYGFCTLRVDAYKPFGEDNYCSYGERRTDEGNAE